MEIETTYTVYYMAENMFGTLSQDTLYFEKAKEAVQTIFDKISAVNPAWQNLTVDNEDAENEWAVYSFNYVGEDAKYLLKSNIGITVFPILYNPLLID